MTLEVSNLSVRFGGIVALDQMSLTVEQGQICGLIGPNGAGKTTLFNCVSRIYQPIEGSITLNGLDLLKVPAHKIASNGVARTFQNLGLFPSMTFLENVMAGAHSTGRVGYLRALSRVGVASEERRLEREGYELLEIFGLAHLASVEAKGQPYGTLKRLELARALAAHPAMLLLDEPAGGLSHSEVDELAGTIVQARDAFDLTVLVVEHHMGMVMKMSDKVVAMNFGRKLAEGTPDEIRKHPEVIAAYLGKAS